MYVSDPYVRVELSQPRRTLSRKTTKTKKSSSEPLFNEIFNFNISLRKEDLRETRVLVTVFDRERIRSDEVIGQVNVSRDALQTTAMDQWMECFNNPGEQIQRWHDLLDHDEDI